MQKGLTPKHSKYYWIELVPMLILLVLVVIFLSVTPNCIDNSSCVEYAVGDNLDIEGLEYEGFMADLKNMRAEIHEETLIAKNFQNNNLELSDAIGISDAIEVVIETNLEIVDKEFTQDHGVTYIRDLCF